MQREIRQTPPAISNRRFSCVLKIARKIERSFFIEFEPTARSRISKPTTYSKACRCRTSCRAQLSTPRTGRSFSASRARDRLAQAHGTGGDRGARGRAGRRAGQVRVSLLCLPKTSSGAMPRGACTRGSPEGASGRENRVGLLWMRACGSRVATQDCKLVAERNDRELQIRAAAKPTSEP